MRCDDALDGSWIEPDSSTWLWLAGFPVGFWSGGVAPSNGLSGGDLSDFAQVVFQGIAVLGKVEYIGERPHIAFEKFHRRLAVLIGSGGAGVFYCLEDYRRSEATMAVKL